MKLLIVYSIALILLVTGCASFSNTKHVWSGQGTEQEAKTELSKCYRDSLQIPVRYNVGSMTGMVRVSETDRQIYLYQCMNAKGYKLTEVEE